MGLNIPVNNLGGSVSSGKQSSGLNIPLTGFNVAQPTPVKKPNIFQKIGGVISGIFQTHEQSNAEKLKLLTSQVQQFTVPSTGNFWKDAVNVLPALILGGAKTVVNPALTLAEAAKPKNRETGLQFDVPLVGGVKSNFSGAEADYNKMIQSGMSDKQAFFQTALRTGIDMSVLVGLARGIGGSILKKVNPEILLKTQPIDREVMTKILNGEENIDPDLLKAFKSLPVEQRVQVAKGILTDIPEAKPSTIGRAFKISDEEAQTLYDQIIKSKAVEPVVPKQIAPEQPTNPTTPTTMPPEAPKLTQETLSTPKGIIPTVPESLQPQTQIELTSGLNPNIDKFIQQDIAPIAKGAISGVAKTWDTIKKTFAPATRGETAQKTASILRTGLGKAARDKEMVFKTLQKSRAINRQ